MKISYREIIIKNIPHAEDDENFYNNALKKINEMLVCLEAKDLLDSVMEKNLSPSIAEKLKDIIVNLYENYSSEEFGKVIRSSDFTQILESDCLSGGCKKIDAILGFYKTLAALIEKDRPKNFLFSFCVARKCLCLKQVQAFYRVFKHIPEQFGTYTEDTISLTRFCLEKSQSVIEELNAITDIFSDIRWEEISENAEEEISDYTKEQNDALDLSSNYLLQIYDDQRFKESEEKIKQLRNGKYNSRNQKRISELISAQKELVAELENEKFNAFLSNLKNQDDRDYWRGIYDKWIKTRKINSSAVNRHKTTDEVLDEAVQWYKQTVRSLP